jgi:hypothetical protein
MSNSTKVLRIPSRLGAWLILLALVPAAVAIGCGGSSDPSAYLAEERCQPPDDVSDAGDGYVPSPEELLPDPEACPEFYEGGEDGWAPPVTVNPGSGEPVETTPEDPCSTTPSLNGFPCYDGPNGPIYVSP